MIAILHWACQPQKPISKTTNNPPSVPVCKITDKYDEFTKKRNVASGPYLMFSEKIDLTKSTLNEFNYQENSAKKSTSLDFYFYARWENGKKIIGLVKYVWQVQNYLGFTQNDPDPKVMFILSNDSVLTITPSTVEPAKLSDNGFEIQRIIFEIDNNTWAQLRDFPPKKMRIRYVGSNYRSIYNKDITIEEKYREQIPFALKCIDDLNLPN